MQPMNQFTDPNNTTVFVGGLSGYVTEDELRSFFQGFGEITYVKIPPGKGCGSRPSVGSDKLILESGKSVLILVCSISSTMVDPMWEVVEGLGWDCRSVSWTVISYLHKIV